MLKLEDYQTLFLIASLAGSLVISWPAVGFVLPVRGGERFSELYVLGPGRMAEDYPFNVLEDEEYRVYLGVGNHMGGSAYYLLYVKLRGQTEPLPNSTDGTASPLPALFEYRAVLGEGEVWEEPLDFSFKGLLFSGDGCSVETLSLNGLDVDVGKMVSWDEENRGFYLELFVELWIYDAEVEGFSFHDRFVGIWLNMTG